MTAAVCVVGSLNLDLVATTRRLPAPGETVLGTGYAEHPGGKGLNQAVAVARAGASCALVGCVGDDDAGVRLRRLAAAEAIDVTCLVDRHEPTGRALIGVDEAGENFIIVVPGANARLDVEVVASARALLLAAPVVLAQLEVPLDAVTEAFRVASAAGAVTVLNPAPAVPLHPELLAACSVVVPNEHELELAGGPEHLLASGVRHVVVTEGARGVRVIDARGTRRIEPFRVEAVDSTAAGDAFCGTLCARLAAGVPLDAAVTAAAAAGALAATVPGATPSLPTCAEVDRLLATAGR